jgi:glycerate 2-kinase
MTYDLRKDARQIFEAGLHAADPRDNIKRVVVKDGNIMTIGTVSYDLNHYERILVVGTGKAAAPLAQALEDILGPLLTGGIITTKYGHSLPLTTVSCIEAAHPVPDEAGLKGSHRILELLEGTGEKDLILCIISGGGSALVPLPVAGITLEDKQKTTQELLACGANIHEINAIRKHISGIKGGKLARAAYPGTLVTLMLSDVIGDNFDVIASGPTVPDESTFADCLAILEKYGITGTIPPNVLTYLKRGVAGDEPETPKPGDPVFNKTNALIIGSAGPSIAAAHAEAKLLGYNSLILSSFIEGETKDVALVHAAIVKEILKSGNPVAQPACIISGGETTVTLHGDGLGGRNMEFALAAAIEISELEGVLMMSGGTDGTDGPTDAAGAFADGSTLQRAAEKGLQAAAYLRNNDSYHFFQHIDDLLKTGPTMTNVMDLRISLVR